MTASARRACACSPTPRGRWPPDVWVVAPERKWTAASHQLSFDRVLTLTRVGGARIRVLGRAGRLRGRRDDVALCGRAASPTWCWPASTTSSTSRKIIAYSGTMAIAREATFWDVPAIGLSRDGVGASAPAAVRGDRPSAARAVGGTRGVERAGALALAQPARPVAGAAGAGARRPRQDRRGVRDPRVDGGAHRPFASPAAAPARCTPGDERAVVAAGGSPWCGIDWLADAAIPRATVEAWIGAALSRRSGSLRRRRAACGLATALQW